MTPFRKLFSIHAGTALARQFALRDFLGQHNWQLNSRKGTVDFDNGRVFPIQLIGSESEFDGSWLWAWANKHLQRPRYLLRAVKIVRRFGRRNNVRELTDGYFPLAFANGHRLAMTCIGLVDNTCYYRGAYDEGVAYFFVMDLPKTIFEPAIPPRILFVINSAIAELEIDHRLMIENFLRTQEFFVEESDNMLTATRPDGVLINVTFDKQGRMKTLNSKLTRGK
jgi:hypothetical protein